MDEETKHKLEQILKGIERIEKAMATSQAQLDAVIAGLPTQIETAVETALQPVITAIQQAAASNGVDLTNEVNSLNAIPAAVASAVASAVAPPTAGSGTQSSA